LGKGSVNDAIKNEQIDFKTKVKFAIDAARGLNFLHQRHPPIVHKDLKTHNLLVGEVWGKKKRLTRKPFLN
jgi:serine/threonine protein kinase